ncbi:hypothetical protein GGQ85_003767 [Nitrobacter vulgaris]|nr:hypothetical protein [Nitrobacter vulgaris]
MSFPVLLFPAVGPLLFRLPRRFNSPRSDGTSATAGECHRRLNWYLNNNMRLIHGMVEKTDLAGLDLGAEYDAFAMRTPVRILRP